MARSFSEIADALVGRPQSNIDELIAGLPSKADIESILGEIEATEREIAVLEKRDECPGICCIYPGQKRKDHARPR